MFFDEDIGHLYIAMHNMVIVHVLQGLDHIPQYHPNLRGIGSLRCWKTAYPFVHAAACIPGILHIRTQPAVLICLEKEEVGYNDSVMLQLDDTVELTLQGPNRILQSPIGAIGVPPIDTSEHKLF